VRSVGLGQALVEGAQIERRLTGVERVPQGRLAVLDDGAAGGEVVLVELNPDAHVEQVADPRALVGGGCDLRHVIRHLRLRIELTACDRDPGDQSQNRFRHRHQYVRRRRRHAVGVMLVDQLAPVQDDQRVGMSLFHERIE